MTPKKTLQILSTAAFLLALLASLAQPAQAATGPQLNRSPLRLEKAALTGTLPKDTPDPIELTLVENPAVQDGLQQAAPAAPAAALTCGAPVRIMPVGDSITKGSTSGVSPDDPVRYVSYRRNLWNSLKEKNYDIDFVGSQNWGSYYQDPGNNGKPWGFDPDNEGHGGWTDYQVYQNIYNEPVGANWLSNYPTDVILLHIGTNEVDTNPADVEAILDEVDEYESDHNTIIWVIIARIIDRVPHDPTTSEFNNQVLAMVDQRISGGDKIIKANMETGAGIVYQIQPNGDMYDGKHPYRTGYAKMATQWENKINDILPYCARDDNPSVPEDGGPVAIDVFANDGGTGLSLGSWQPHPSGTLGTVAPAGDGKSFVYTPPPNFVGQDRFLYTVGYDPDDPPPNGSEMTALVTVTVTETNDAPTVVDDTLSATEDTPLVFSADDLADNDLKGPSSESGQALTVTQVTPGASTHGALALSSGEITYTPEANYTGPASFEYKVCDDGAPSLCDTGAANVSVAAVNDLPVISAFADQATQEDTARGPLAFTISDVETAAGSLSLSAKSSDPTAVPDANIVFGGAGGSRTVTITPAPNQFSSGVTITLTVVDGEGGKTSKSFKLVINPVDDAPVVVNPGDRHVEIGEPLLIQIQADDPDLAAGEEQFEYLIDVQPPTGQNITINSQTGFVTGVIASGGSYTVDIFVRSGSLTGQTSFVISTTQYLVYLPNLIDRMSFGP